MRVISQLGTVDLPYEQICVRTNYQEPTKIIAWGMAQIDDSCAFLAEYSTEEKTIKAMEMLRETFQYTEECKYRGNGESRMEFTFRFPADDEIEV
jgi:hypothetical protein